MTDDLDLDTPREPLDSMLDKAWRRVSQALDAGHSTEALRWMRLHDRLLAAERTEQRDRDRSTAEEMRAVIRTARGIQTQAVSMARQVQAASPGLKPEPNTVQSKNFTAVPPTTPDPDEPGLSRAERRRRLKYRARSP